MPTSSIYNAFRTLFGLSLSFAVSVLGAYGCGAGDSVGAPCEAIDECGAGLLCAHAAIMPGQCTTTCDDTSTCTAQFAQGSFCIGAGLCVLACRDDADCPSDTVCSEYKLCQR